MEKIELKRSEVITLFNSMQSYVKEVGKNTNKLAHLCDHIMTYPPNEEFIEKHNKDAGKLSKEFERGSRKAMNNNATMYVEGEKKGTFVLDEKGELTFDAEGKNKANDEIDILGDTYQDKVADLMKEKVEFYVETTVAPENLSSDYKYFLDLLISK